MSTHEPGRPQPPAVRETSRQRATRIPLDYFKRIEGLERWRLGLSALALVVVLGGWAAWSWVRGDQVRGTYSRGPVAAVHAAWDNDCAACHRDFVPITARQANPATRLVAGTLAAGHGRGDENCINCHAGPPHHASQREDATPGCADCHREHRGRDFSLVLLPDSDCTGCHANLKASLQAGASARYENKVTGFATDHPKFGSLGKDPGTLKFNHKLHMTAGQVQTSDQVRASDQARPWTLGRLQAVAGPEAADRYRKAPWQKDKQDSAPVTLDCGSCHVRDAGDQGGVAGAPRAAGAYMQPVTYEANCKACHPLTFDPQVKGQDGQPVAVPHHLQPPEVRDFLWGAYANRHAKNDPELAKRLKAPSDEGPPPAPLPGKKVEEARNAIGGATDKASNFLFLGSVKLADTYLMAGKTSCGECHHFESAGGRPAKVLPTDVTGTWFKHARFNHAAHKAVDCRACHDKAAGSESAADVLVPGIENCRECHAPRKQTANGPVGGVRHDCVECHGYHNADHPLQGPGGAGRDPKDKRTISDFLRGAGG